MKGDDIHRLVEQGEKNIAKHPAIAQARERLSHGDALRAAEGKLLIDSTRKNGPETQPKQTTITPQAKGKETSEGQSEDDGYSYGVGL